MKKRGFSESLHQELSHAVACNKIDTLGSILPDNIEETEFYGTASKSRSESWTDAQIPQEVPHHHYKESGDDWCDKFVKSYNQDKSLNKIVGRLETLEEKTKRKVCLFY